MLVYRKDTNTQYYQLISYDPTKYRVDNEPESQVSFRVDDIGLSVVSSAKSYRKTRIPLQNSEPAKAQTQNMVIL
ncbi:hypothetical protein NQ314_017819 [Rhamnusium bicolor]|uniref:Uncharacterized protein n=1 Tax=Rhamnusium bicolor TaxID=1586634 RepID=A0AAV8WTH6_9CUCU|nr:hypothetical protein NQ314_017819 [Rhamnusium bicolor]